MAAALLVAAMVGGCRRASETAPGAASPEPDGEGPSTRAADAARARSSRPDGPSSPPPQTVVDAATAAPVRASLMAEVQAIVDGGADPAKLARLIGTHAGEPDALLARKTALYVLKGVAPLDARVAALIQAAAIDTLPVEADPLWPELVDALAETWTMENGAAGRRRMLRERDPRVRRLLVASMARYAGSSRGLSNLTNSERRSLRAELRSVRPQVPPDVQADIDAALPKLVHDSRVRDR